MRVGVVSDVHGNLVGLEAVLADVAGERVDRVVCLGDVAAMGPQPGEAVARVRGLGWATVKGNTDEWLDDPAAGTGGAGEGEDARRIAEIVAWGAGRLSGEDRAWLGALPATVEVPLGEGVALLCYHGSPRSNTDRILPTTPDDELERLLDGHAAAVCVGGHTHLAMLRRHRERLVVNPGSVSLPVQRFPTVPPSRTPPWAEYALIGWEEGRLSVELRGVPLDLDAVEGAARGSGMPHAAWWIAGWR